MPIAASGLPTGRRSLAKSQRLAAWAAPLLFVAVLFYLPLFSILRIGFDWQSLGTLATGKTAALIGFTIGLALTATALCLMLGIAGAYLLYRKDFLGARIFRAVITVPFVLPVIVVAIGFAGLKNLLGILLAMVFINFSITARAVGSQWLSLDNATEEAATLDGAGRFRAFWSVALPQLRSSIVSAGSLTFLYCVSSFGIVLVLGGGLVHSIETEIYSSALSFLDLKTASALALAQLAITLLAFSLSAAFSKQSLGLSVIETEKQQPRLDSRDWPVITLGLAIVAPMLALPIGFVLTQAFSRDGLVSLANFTDLAGHGARGLLDITVLEATQNSLRNAFISTLLATILGLLVSLLLHRSKNRAFQAAMDFVFLLPIGVSMVIIGLGYLLAFSTEPFALRSSWLVVPIAQTLAALPLVIRLVFPALQALDPALAEAAATDGAGPSRVWWSIELPMIRTAVQTAIGFAAVASIGEFGAASFLAYGDQATLPTVLYRLISRPGAQNYGMAMAVSAILIALTFAVVGLIEIRRVPGSKQSAAS